MSDLAATGCGNNDCGCGNSRSGGLLCNMDSCSLLWIIVLLSVLNNNSCGCDSGILGRNGGGCDWLILILLFSCFCGNNDGCGCC